jgi:hypothetical protein
MIEERARTTAMHDSGERLREALRDTVDLIRRSGGGVVLEEFPGALQEEPSGEPTNGTDASRVRAAQGAAGATHRTLLDAAEALAETLAQIDTTPWRIHPLQSRQATP